MCVMHSLIQLVPTHISVQVVMGSKRGAKKHFCGTFSKKYLGLHTLLSEIQSFTDIGLYSQIHIYIRLMKGHVTGVATFHQGVLLDNLH